MKLLDTFIFYNELDLLLYRLSTLYDVIDHFVIVESTLTFTGKQKPLYYQENISKFERFSDKIIYILVDDLIEEKNINIKNKDQWRNEYHQRNSIDKGISLLNLNNDDLIIISDVDEIPDKRV